MFVESTAKMCYNTLRYGVSQKKDPAVAKASFVMPAWKGRFLHEAIASILAQTEKDFELIVVDDASPDGLESIVSSFRDPRISYHRNPQNIGSRNLVQAWNHAVSFATAPFCILAGDDDLYSPSYLEEMLSLASKYPSCDLFHCAIAEIDSSGSIRNISEPRAELESQIQMAYWRAARRLWQTAPEFMFRREALSRIGGFVPFPLANHSDDATWLLLARNSCACSGKVLFKWRFSGINISSRSDDIPAKHAAYLAFSSWFSHFASTLSPQTADESLMLSNISQIVSSIAAGMACGSMRSIHGFIPFLKALFASPFPRRMKLHFLCDRLPLLRLIFLPSRIFNRCRRLFNGLRRQR